MKFHWRWHDSAGSARRVWLENWSGDQFEVMGAIEFEELRRTLERFGAVFTEHTDD